jgi:outer membrane protein assembly factor BamB
MSNRQGHSHSIKFLAFLCLAGLLLCGIASAATSITLSKKTGPPTSRILVSGRGFAANASVDIYFDTKDEAVATADAAGSFSRIAIPAPASASPGTHWVSGVERAGRGRARVRFDVHTEWKEFHRWDMARWNTRENVLNVHNVKNLQVKWSFPVAGVTSGPTFFDGVVYVAANDDSVYALNAETGAELWSYTAGYHFYSGPAVANGIVYAGCQDSNLYALDAHTGTKLWSFEASSWFSSSPAVANGMVYIGSNDDHVYALNAKTGAKVWSYATGFEVVSSPAVVDGVVYLGSTDSNVYALKATTGAKLWSYTTGGDVSSSPAVTNGVVFIGSDDGNLYALNAKTGIKLWSYSTIGAIDSSPAVANGIVYFGSTDNEMYALNAATGAKLWSYPMKFTGFTLYSSPAAANGVIYVASYDGNVYALDAKTGAKLWSYDTQYEVESSPAVTDGVLYIGSNDNMYAFGLPRSDEARHRTAPPNIPIRRRSAPTSASSYLSRTGTPSGAER